MWEGRDNVLGITLAKNESQSDLDKVKALHALPGLKDLPVIK